MIFKLSLAKEPDEIWAISIDVSARLAPDEGIVLVEGGAYEVLSEEVLITKDLASANITKVAFSFTSSDGSTETVLFPVGDVDKVSLVAPRRVTVPSEMVWVPARLMISQDRSKFQVVIQGGESGKSYELDLNIHTMQFASGNPIEGTELIHKLRLQWDVRGRV